MLKQFLILNYLHKIHSILNSFRGKQSVKKETRLSVAAFLRQINHVFVFLIVEHILNKQPEISGYQSDFIKLRLTLTVTIDKFDEFGFGLKFLNVVVELAVSGQRFSNFAVTFVIVLQNRLVVSIAPNLRRKNHDFLFGFRKFFQRIDDVKPRRFHQGPKHVAAVILPKNPN